MWLLIWLSVDSPLLRGCLWWDTHGVQISSFCFCCGVHSSGRVWCILFFSPCLVVRLLVVRPTWGVETGSPPLKTSGYFFMNRGFFGGRGIARPASSSHLRCVLPLCRCVLRRRKDWHLFLPPHNVEEFSGGGGTGPPPHKSGEYFGGGGTGLLPHIDGTYDDYSLVAQCRMIVSKIELGR